MPHLVNTFGEVTLSEARGLLEQVHHYMVDCAVESLRTSHVAKARWGTETKREAVRFSRPDRPALLGKESERFAEVVNMVATIERLIDALVWFETCSQMGTLSVVMCHPSTSSVDTGGSHTVLLEVQPAG